MVSPQHRSFPKRLVDLWVIGCIFWDCELADLHVNESQTPRLETRWRSSEKLVSRKKRQGKDVPRFSGNIGKNRGEFMRIYANIEQSGIPIQELDEFLLSPTSIKCCDDPFLAPHTGQPAATSCPKRTKELPHIKCSPQHLHKNGLSFWLSSPTYRLTLCTIHCCTSARIHKDGLAFQASATLGLAEMCCTWDSLNHEVQVARGARNHPVFISATPSTWPLQCIWQFMSPSSQGPNRQWDQETRSACAKTR